MLRPTLLSAFSMLALAKFSSAKDCSTHSFTSCADGIVHWYDPDTGQVCDPLDCGGGRAPPKTNVPGCVGYTGTEQPTTSYLSCWKPSITEALSSAKPTTELETTAEALSSAKPTTELEITTQKDTQTEVETVETSTITARSTTKQATSLSQESATSIPTTPAATLSTQTPTAESNTSGQTSTTNAGNLLGGSLMIAAGAALVGIVIV